MAFLINTEVRSLPATPAAERMATPLPPLLPEAPRPAGGGRYQSLDLWRGVACMCLVLYHAAFYVDLPRDETSLAEGIAKAVHKLWVGVPMFFVVSGYCIAASVASRERKPYAVGTFFARRLKRIYPPLWAGCAWAVGVTLLIAFAWPVLYAECRHLPRLAEMTAWNWLGNLTASESWLHHVSGDKQAFLLRNTWTMGLEEQFYVICGILIWLSSRRFYLGVAFVTAATLLCRHAGRMWGFQLDGTFLHGYWMLFAAGILLFHQMNRATPRGQTVCYGLFGVALVYALVDRFVLSANADQRHMAMYLVAACLFALSLRWLHRFDAAWTNAAWAKPLFWCGKHSYSIYLAHYPVVVTLSCALDMAGLNHPWEWLVLVLPACVVTSVAAGWVFYQVVERHFQNSPVTQPTKPTTHVARVVA